MNALPRNRFAPSPLIGLAVALGGGILASHLLNLQSEALFYVDAALGLLLTALALLFALRNKMAAATGSVVAAFFCAGFVLLQIDHRPLALNRITQLVETGLIGQNDPVEITGTVEGQPEPAPESFYLTLRAERIAIRGVERDATGTISLFAREPDSNVTHEYDALDLRHGARVRVLTKLEREETFRNPGVMPFTEYLERKNLDATGVIKSPLLIERLDNQRIFLPMAWLYEWRAFLEREFNEKFSAETAGVLDAALLGNRYNVSREAADRFRAGGTFHVLVIAGLHISFIGGVAFLVARLLTRRRLFQFLLSATFLWAYTLAVGAHAPVVRAALMFTLVALAPVVARRANSPNVIGGAAIALLLWRPGDLFDPSFQLTFLSVLGIASIAVPLLQKMQYVGSWRPTAKTPFPPAGRRWFRALPELLFWSERSWRAEIACSNVTYKLFKTPLAAKLERWHLQGLLRFAMAAVIVSASVQVVLLPLLVIYFHRLSIASLVLNIFVGVLMVLLAFFALTAIVVSHASAWLGALLIQIAEKVSWLMIHLVDPFTHFNLASIRLPHYSGWLASVYALYFLPLGLLILAFARWNPLRPPLMVKVKQSKLSTWKIPAVFAAFIFFLAIIVWHPLSVPRPDGNLHADFLDVGQGDSALLTMPDGTTLLIDGGGRPTIGREDAEEDLEEPFERDSRSIGEGVVSEFLWAKGLDRVDYILPTHADSDHIDGLNDVARNFSVRGAIVARTPSDDAEYRRFATTMQAFGVPVVMTGAGDVLRFGNVAAEVLWPPASADPNAPSANNDGLVLLVRYGDKAFLFAGDIEKQAEAGILKRTSNMHSDIVKVAHHGSRTSSTEAFVAGTRPSLAIISVGRNSIFGHPNKEVVERWRASGATVMTTGERGTISAVTDGKDLRISTFVR
jgi:competence protein ComEC